MFSGSFEFETKRRRTELFGLSFYSYAYTFDEILRINEAISNTYDYCNLVFQNKRLVVMEWQSDLLTELEHGLWQGSVDYDIILQKDL